jgi:hypothetical protein
MYAARRSIPEKADKASDGYVSLSVAILVCVNRYCGHTKLWDIVIPPIVAFKSLIENPQSGFTGSRTFSSFHIAVSNLQNT